MSPTLAREALARAGHEPAATRGEVTDWGTVLQCPGGDSGGRGTGRLAAIAGSRDRRVAGVRAVQADPVRGAGRGDGLDERGAGRVRQGHGGTGTGAGRAGGTVGAADHVGDGAGDTAPGGAAGGTGRAATRRTNCRRLGEALLAFGHGLPAGARDFTHDGRTIELDPRRSVVENAQRYFARARDRRTAARETPIRMRRTELELGFLRQAADDLARADSPGVRQAIEATLAEAGYGRSNAKRQAVPSASQWTLGRASAAGGPDGGGESPADLSASPHLTICGCTRGAFRGLTCCCDVPPGTRLRT